MTTTNERKQRLEEELAKFSSVALSTPLYDLPGAEETGGPLCPLTSETGDASPLSWIHDNSAWGLTLREAIIELVDSIFTLDGVTYDTLVAIQYAR